MAMLNNQRVRVRVTGMAQNEFPRNFWDEIRPLGAHKCRHGAQKIFTKCFGNPWLFPMCIYIYYYYSCEFIGKYPWMQISWGQTPESLPSKGWPDRYLDLILCCAWKQQKKPRRPHHCMASCRSAIRSREIFGGSSQGSKKLVGIRGAIASYTWDILRGLTNQGY